MKALNRKNAYLKNGDPRHVRCYFKKSDEFEPYTVVFIGTKKLDGCYTVLAMNRFGDYFHFECEHIQGLGKKISWQDLPEGCKRTVLREYSEMYGKIAEVNLKND